jgi:hypothetical protein
MLDDNLEILYCRIDLSKTDYTQIDSARVISAPDLTELKLVFKKYCDHKKFTSVEPMWDHEFIWTHNDVIGYYDSASIGKFGTRFDSRDVFE